MKNLRIVLILTALFAAIGTVRAVESPKASKPDVAAITKNADLQSLIQDFNKRRDAILADREAFLNQLKTATAEQRQQILEKMRSQQKELVDAQRAIGKQIRDEMRKMKLATPAGH